MIEAHEPFPFNGTSAEDGWVAHGWRPHFWSLLLAFSIYFLLCLWSWQQFSRVSPINLYTAFFWTLPTLATLVGIYGAIRTRKYVRARYRGSISAAIPRVDEELLIMVVPTIGRRDTLPALERVLASSQHFLSTGFSEYRIDVLIEASCECRQEIRAVVDSTPCARTIVVPGNYRTPNGTKFKARANEYARCLRNAEGEARDDVWVLHMDDDTAVGPDTAAELARFVLEQREAGSRALHLCQGVLCYPRELATNKMVWLADSIRPGCDIGLFAATTGRGRPLSGLHGELLMVRASTEDMIGWDFGPRTLVEDAQFAMLFCRRCPGRSGWIAGRSYGASPATVTEFIIQRERWVWGLLELAAGRHRGPTGPQGRVCSLLMLHNTLIWALAPFGHPIVVLAVCTALQDFRTAPLSPVLIPIWALNVSFYFWLYWEGFKINARSSAVATRATWEIASLLVFIPIFSIWEMAGVTRGVWRFLSNGVPHFSVISKPA